MAANALAQDLSGWSDKTICRLIDEKHSSLLTQLLQETKTRRLICNNGKIAGYTSPKVASPEPTSNTESSEDNDYICLSCGVESSSSTTKTSSDCSFENVKACSDALVCSRGSGLFNGKRLWEQRPYWIKYVVEAKRRGLSCGVFSVAAADLPNCQ